MTHGQCKRQDQRQEGILHICHEIGALYFWAVHFTLESLYACESIGNGLRVIFLDGFMLRRTDRLQIVSENDHFAYRHGSSSSSEDFDFTDSC